MENPVGENKTLEQLLLELNNPDEKQRAISVLELGKYGAPAIEPLINILRTDSYYFARRSAVKALDQIGDRRTIPALIEALKEYGLMSFAGEALFKFGDTSVIPAMIASLQDSTGGHHFGLVADVIVQYGETAVIPLLEALKQPKPRRWTAYILGRIEDNRAVAPLFEIARDKQMTDNEREAAITALGNFPDPQIFELLQQLMRDTSETDMVRRFATEALGNFGQASLPYIIEALKDDIIGYNAAVALAKADIDGIPAILEASREKDKKIRAGAVTALGMVGNPTFFNLSTAPTIEGLPPLIQALKDPIADIRKRAINGIWNIISSITITSMLFTEHSNQGQLPSPEIEKKLKPPNFDRETVLEPVLTALKDESYEVRYSAAMVLGQLGIKDGRVVKALLAALSDRDSDVRFRTIEALVQLDVTAPEGEKIFKKLLKDKNHATSGSAALLLEKLK